LSWEEAKKKKKAKAVGGVSSGWGWAELTETFLGILKFDLDLFSSFHYGHHPQIQHGLVNVTHWPANSKIHLVQCVK
jgi:surfactin synthase thioesterase subunit